MESALSKHLFVYSSLRKGFHQHAYDYISQFFSFVSPAKVNGIANEVNEELFAKPVDDNSFVKGELYQLNEEHDFSYVFGQLDDYEGVVTEPGEKSLYMRELIKAHKEDGATIDAWIFWFNGEVSEKTSINSEDIAKYPG